MTKTKEIERADVEKVVNDLDTLATEKGVDAVVALLIKSGAKGTRNNIYFCVLIDYIRSRTAEGVQVEVDPIEVVMQKPGPGRIRIGAALADFIRRFDTGEFPELEGTCRK